MGTPTAKFTPPDIPVLVQTSEWYGKIFHSQALFSLPLALENKLDCSVKYFTISHCDHLIGIIIYNINRVT